MLRLKLGYGHFPTCFHFHPHIPLTGQSKSFLFTPPAQFSAYLSVKWDAGSGRAGKHL